MKGTGMQGALFLIISSFFVFIVLSISLSLRLYLSLSLSLTSEHSLRRLPPPIMFVLIYIFNFLPLSLSRRFPYSLSSAFPASRPFLSITRKEEGRFTRKKPRE